MSKNIIFVLFIVQIYCFNIKLSCYIPKFRNSNFPKWRSFAKSESYILCKNNSFVKPQDFPCKNNSFVKPQGYFPCKNNSFVKPEGYIPCKNRFRNSNLPTWSIL